MSESNEQIFITEKMFFNLAGALDHKVITKVTDQNGEELGFETDENGNLIKIWRKE